MADFVQDHARKLHAAWVKEQEDHAAWVAALAVSSILDEKHCRLCHRMLPLEQFSISNKSGILKTYCRECMAELSRKWYRDNRERARERMSQYNTERNKSRSNPVGRPKRDPLDQLSQPIHPVGRPKRRPNDLGQMQCCRCRQWLSPDRYSRGQTRCKFCVSVVYYAKQRYCNLSLAEKQRRNEARRLRRRRATQDRITGGPRK
jgi:hypothetical protein